MSKLPVIGVLSTRQETPALPVPLYYTTGHYIEQLEAAGGLPVQLPLARSTGPEQLAGWVALCDGFLLPGGGDLSPALYGEPPLPGFETEVSAFELQCQRNELELIRRAAAAGKPMLGICLGQQAINVAFGGTLYQDLPAQLGGRVNHRQPPAERTRVTHPVAVMPGTLLHTVLGLEQVWVNTYHHQAVKTAADGFAVSARAEDGVIEALEAPQRRILGVQWHPENLAHAGRPEAQALFRWLVREAEG